MTLTEYNKKRSFERTREPRGRTDKKRSSRPLHFVVQKHDASRLHYDFRLELDGVLKSWAVPKGPSLNPNDKRLAMMVEDHPVSYGTFEGSIPRGEYGAGDVIVWDTGVYSSEESADPEESRKRLKQGLYKGELKFILLGQKLKGGFALIKMKGREKNAWLLIKERDEFADDRDITEDVGSVLSDAVLPLDKKKSRKKADKGGDPMPHDVRPMLATLVDAPFDREGWIFETKWDGYRAIAEVKDGRVHLYSRNQRAFTDLYTPVVAALKDIPHRAVLDGEIIALKEGRADFHTLQQYKDNAAPLRYMLFDLLYLDGHDLRTVPLVERKKLLRDLIPRSDVLGYSEHRERYGTQLFDEIRKKGVEGIVAKDGKSPYREGRRTEEWLKIKSVQEQEAIIVGYTEPRGSRKLIGALVLAAYDNGELRYIGHSGGGFTDRELKNLHTMLSKIRKGRSPLRDKVSVNSPITWVEPRYVCQIKFSEWTPSMSMRHPIFVGMRSDKRPKDVVIERPQNKETARVVHRDALTLTHREKVFWLEEGYTKGDLLDYYEEMTDLVLPYLLDRPQNLNRHPNGYKGKNFYQKNITTKLPDFVATAKIWSDSNAAELNYIVCQNRETLLYLANLGCIELNPWSSRVGNIERPDYMILDLDPHGRSFDDVIRVAREVKSVLDKACEISFPKTSGKTGLHIAIPLGARYRYEDVRQFAELIMRIVHRKMPDITTLERNPKKRGDKMYLDFLQNRFGQTIASPYSVRPYPGATVSTPLDWSEVKEGLDPSKFTIRTIGKRVKKKGDLWKGVLSKGVDLSDAIRCLQEHL